MIAQETLFRGHAAVRRMRHGVLSLAALCALTHTHTAEAADDVVVIPWPKNPHTTLNATKWKGIVPSTGRSYTAYAGIQQGASLFSIELPPNGCSSHTNTSVSARIFNCELATNGGFFAFTPPACQGNLIINRTVVQYPGNVPVNIGVSADGNTVIGYIGADTYKPYHFISLLQGNGWLVRDGKSYVSKSRELQPPNSTFVTEKAPRTGVGVLRDGSVMILVVDGVESLKQGVDLFEFAEVFLSQGALHAINLDGGGSTDAVLRGNIWNYPTCEDLPFQCERAVTSITCLRYPPNSAA